MTLHPLRNHARCAGLAALLMVALGCARPSGDDPAQIDVEPITQSEAQRGRQACDAYVAQVCACARATDAPADLAEACHMAPAKVSSLAAVIEVNRTTKDLKERVTTERTAHRIIKSCFDQQSKLLARGCRPPAASAGQPAPKPTQ